MQTKKYEKARRGLGMIELIVYVAILALLLSVIANTLFIVGRSYTGLRIGSQMATAASGVFEKILLEGRRGATINNATSVFDSSAGAITFVREDATSVRFYVNAGRLYFDEGGVAVGPLTPASVIVDDFTVRRIDGTIVDGVKIDLTMSSVYKTISQTKTFHTSVMIRN